MKKRISTMKSRLLWPWSLYAVDVLRRGSCHVLNMAQTSWVGNVGTAVSGRRTTSALAPPTFAMSVTTSGRWVSSREGSCRLASPALGKIAASLEGVTQKTAGMGATNMRWVAPFVLRTLSAVLSYIKIGGRHEGDRERFAPSCECDVGSLA
mmetsp:Transcript_65000/g.121058  ORF Transcript_65000/g.121058 Transcript_65000/m.121058 type:complete len:152 (-) Transcript_65000:111-566(-)